MKPQPKTKNIIHNKLNLIDFTKFSLHKCNDPQASRSTHSQLSPGVPRNSCSYSAFIDD